MTNSGLLPVFVDTSLDTHLAIAVSSDDTVASFKRKFVTEHGLCFPEVGRINIEALMTCWQGKEYHLSETLPISAVLQIEGGCFLEALVVTQVRPDTDNQLFSDPLHHQTEAAARAINSSMKKKRKRNASFEDTTLRPTESMKGGEEFEGHGQNRQSNDSYCDANAGEAKKGESRKAERTDIKAGGWGEYPDESRRQKKANVLQMPANDASIAVREPEYIKEAPPCLEKAKDIFGKHSRHDSESPEIPGPTKEKAKNDDAKKKVRKDDIKKDRSLLEVTQTTGTVLPGVTTGKRKKRRTKGPCSDLPSEVAPIIKHEPQVEDRNQVSQKEKDFNLAEKPGDTWSGSHERGNTKKKEGEKDTSKLSSCHEYNPICKNHTYNVIIAAEEAAITEMAAELKGLSCSSNVLLCKELVPPCKKNLLVLDINGLLADITSDCKNQQYEDFRISGKLGFKRPFCVDFLKFCFANFEVGVWSSRMQHNLERAVNHLFGEMKNKLLFCWDQSKCTATNFKTVEKKPLYFKELNKLWEKVEPDLPYEKGRFTPSNTLLVDDSPCKALRNPPYTAIFPYPYTFKNKEDNSLGRGGDIRIYLEKIAAAENIPEFVEENPFGQPAITPHQHPQWNYYCGILEALKRLTPGF